MPRLEEETGTTIEIISSDDEQPGPSGNAPQRRNSRERAQ